MIPFAEPLKVIQDSDGSEPACVRDDKLATLALSLRVATSSLSRQSLAGAENEWRRNGQGSSR